MVFRKEGTQTTNSSMVTPLSLECQPTGRGECKGYKG